MSLSETLSAVEPVQDQHMSTINTSQGIIYDEHSMLTLFKDIEILWTCTETTTWWCKYNF